MTKKSTICLFFAFSTLFVSCLSHAATADKGYFFLPPDASEIREYRNPNGKQINFSVNRMYPELGLATDWQEKFKSKDLSQCTSSNAGSNLNDWRSYEDRASAGGPKFVHRYMALYSSERQLIYIDARYFSLNSVDGSGRRVLTPDNQRQQLMVLIVTGGKDKLEQFKSTFSASCP